MEIALECLEAAINKCKESTPLIACVLSPDLRRLCDVYGVMIYRKSAVMDVSGFSGETVNVVKKWVDAI